MRKIINGKMYNTETADCVGMCDNNLYYTDFHYVEEALYRKKSGEYFLYGEGGPLTKYAVREGNGSRGGCHIILFTEEEAKKWAEENLTVDEYCNEFGTPEE